MRGLSIIALLLGASTFALAIRNAMQLQWMMKDLVSVVVVKEPQISRPSQQ